MSDRTLRAAGWAMLTFFAITAVGQLAISFQDADAGNLNDWGVGGHLPAVAQKAMTALFPVVAQLIIRRQPRNRIGWLLHAIGFSWAAGSVVGAYVLLALVVRPGSLPGGDVAELLDSAGWVTPIILTAVLVPLLFPHGRPLGPRWRLLTRLAGLDAALTVLAITF